MPDWNARVMRHAGEAVVQWNMIDEGDHVLACLSGGKDSWAMLHVLRQLQQRAPVRFSLSALKVDYPHDAAANARIEAHCGQLGVLFTLVHTSIGDIIRQHGHRHKGHCSFCARLRRGHIYTQAEQMGITRVALGHHREDLNETLLLNLFHHGQLLAMRPCYRPQGHAFDVIRPLALVPEADVAALAEQLGAPIEHESCPLADNNERSRTKALLQKLTADYPHLAGNLLSAQKCAGLLGSYSSGE